MCRNCTKPKPLLIINHELQESASFITAWTVLGIGTRLFHFRGDVRSSQGTLGRTGFGDKWSSPTNLRAAQAKTW